jgi:hypothetical protein
VIGVEAGPREERLTFGGITIVFRVSAYAAPSERAGITWL